MQHWVTIFNIPKRLCKVFNERQDASIEKSGSAIIFRSDKIFT